MHGELVVVDDVPGEFAERVIEAFHARPNDGFSLAVSGAAYAQTNSIDSLTVSKGASGRTIVRFTMKNAPANPPAGFAIASPPRIALDFLDTANGLGTTQRAIEDVALRSVNVIQAGSRTRVVFNLNRPQTFETQVEGNTVVV